MKRGQAGIGLVILGVVAIIAVIGLVLLFTRASKEAQGALLTDLSIGNMYQGTGERGISEVYQTPGNPNTPELTVPYGGMPYKPYPKAVQTKGTRTPSFIVSGHYTQGGYASIEDVYQCEGDLNRAGIGVPHDQFNCYTVPNKGATGQEVHGFFPPASSAYARPPEDTIGKIGGDVYCYANSNGAEQQVPNAEDWVRNNVRTTLVESKAGQNKFQWSMASVNGIDVPVCWVSALTFPFPQ